jgi:uncharacterized membrane protein YjjP (DUF1212 family)
MMNQSYPDIKAICEFIMSYGEALQYFGGTAQRIESNMTDLSKHFSLDGQFFSTPTSLQGSFKKMGDENFDYITRIIRVYPGDTHLKKISALNLITENVKENKSTVREAIQEIKCLSKDENKITLLEKVTYYGLCSSAFIVFLGGNWGDFFFSLFLGSFIGAISFLLVDKQDENLRSLVEIITSFMAIVLASFAARYFSINPGLIALASVIEYLPGLAMTMALSELANRQLASGTARFFAGIMDLLKLTFGVAIGLSLMTSLDKFLPSAHLISFNHIPLWFKWAYLPIAAFGYTLSFHAQLKDYKHIMCITFFSLIVSTTLDHYLDKLLAIVLSSFLLALFSNFLAKRFKKISQMYLLPGLLIMVPGSIGFRSLSYLFNQNTILGISELFNMMSIAMCLVAGIFLGNSFIRPSKS